MSKYQNLLRGNYSLIRPNPKHSPKINSKALKRLKDLLSYQAPSYNVMRQNEIAYKVLSYLQDIKAKFEITTDEYGNFYIVKGESEIYPCVVAHLDQVHKVYKNYEIKQRDDILWAMTWYDGKFDQVGTGGDDLVGVWTCLEALLELPSVKVVLFKDEEVGCRGSGKCDISFFKDCSFILQADRRQDTLDMIHHTNGVNTTSLEFDSALQPIMSKYGYDFNDGTMTDVGELVIKGCGCSAVNISCGYYRAHYDREVVSISGAMTCRQMMLEICTDLGSFRYKHVKQTPNYGNYGGWGSADLIDSDFDDDDFEGDTDYVRHTKKECPQCEDKTKLSFSQDFYFCEMCNFFADKHSI